jgi:hypothetical protein
LPKVGEGDAGAVEGSYIVAKITPSWALVSLVKCRGSATGDIPSFYDALLLVRLIQWSSNAIDLVDDPVDVLRVCQPASLRYTLVSVCILAFVTWSFCVFA